MDFRRLTYFCAIVEEGSISAAARRLNISQPPLSSRLKELEDEVGVPLILRTEGRWTVTEAGQALYQRGQYILNQLDKMVEDVRAYGSSHKGRFSIAVTYAAYSYVLPRIAALLRDNPEISARMLVSDDTSVENAIQNCTADVGITLNPLKFNNYKTVRLAETEYIAVASKNIRLPEKDVLTPEDLCGLPLILLSRWEGIPIKNLMIRNAFKSLGYLPDVRLETADPHHIVDFLVSGVDAVAIVHRTYLSTHDINLQWSDFALSGLSDEVVLIYREESVINSVLENVINALTSRTD